MAVTCDSCKNMDFCSKNVEKNKEDQDVDKHLNEMDKWEKCHLYHHIQHVYFKQIKIVMK